MSTRPDMPTDEELEDLAAVASYGMGHDTEPTRARVRRRALYLAGLADGERRGEERGLRRAIENIFALAIAESPKHDSYRDACRDCADAVKLLLTEPAAPASTDIGDAPDLISRLRQERDHYRAIALGHGTGEGGPAWRDDPTVEGWWLLRRFNEFPLWRLIRRANITMDDIGTRHVGERWFGPVAIPEDK